VGFGRVGSLIGTALAEHGLPYVVIERNPRVFEKHLRAADILAVSGDATLPGVLESVHVERARLLVIASPDGYHARQVLEQARARNPRIMTIVRTHSAAERDYLQGQGVDSVVMGEHELAMTMTAHALRSLQGSAA
jgi:CPA2 family monovalent cation:H+ antiporter-2